MLNKLNSIELEKSSHAFVARLLTKKEFLEDIYKKAQNYASPDAIDKMLDDDDEYPCSEDDITIQ